MTYNGWTNYQTWAVKLHWDNNQGDYNYFQEQCREYMKANKPSWEFADYLKEIGEEIFQSIIEGNANEEAKMMIQDVGNMNDVNWDEIAKAYYEENKNET
ncbi:unnamed protein product [marine sediment metagenome]|uniref:Uncharacterized protein n=1 Tax=marine sediment metagenome TaxID=412755 RepID=X1FS58_9ZZZZ